MPRHLPHSVGGGRLPRTECGRPKKHEEVFFLLSLAVSVLHSTNKTSHGTSWPGRGVSRVQSRAKCGFGVERQ